MTETRRRSDTPVRVISWPTLCDQIRDDDLQNGADTLAELCDITSLVGSRAVATLHRKASADPQLLSRVEQIETQLECADPLVINRLLVDSLGLSDLDAIDATMTICSRLQYRLAS